MPERDVVIHLGEREIQDIEQAVLDRDADAALQFVNSVIWPRVEEAVNRPHCKPIFEWGSGVEHRPSGPSGNNNCPAKPAG